MASSVRAIVSGAEVEDGVGEVGVFGDHAFGAGGGGELGVGVDAEAEGEEEAVVGGEGGFEEVEGFAEVDSSSPGPPIRKDQRTERPEVRAAEAACATCAAV